MNRTEQYKKSSSVQADINLKSQFNDVNMQHSKGKLTARERVDFLLDDNSLVEQQRYITGRAISFGLDKKKSVGDGVITGSGKINGKQIFFSAQDFTVMGGSLGEMHAERIAEIQELSLKNRCPYIQLNDSGGARIQEGILSLNGYAKIFRNNTLASGVVPQISVILGPCAGGAVYSPAITDFIMMVDSVSKMFITGPDVIRSVTGENVSHEELGGTTAHCKESGVAHFRFESEEICIKFLRRFLDYLPSSNQEASPIEETDDSIYRKTESILDVIPEDDRKVYDVIDIIRTVFDLNSFIEVQKHYAKNIVIGFAKLAGRTVGICANQPKTLAAALDINASDKAARFLRFCDSFNIPIITFADVPGFLPGVSQEHGGVIRHGAKLLYAVAEATVPKVAVILRKAYGGSFIAMASKSLGYDRVLAYPSSQIAVMGPEGAIKIIYRKDIARAENPEHLRNEKIREFKAEVMNPYQAASFGYVDDIIEPSMTRIELIRSIEMIHRKAEGRPKKKHGNIPL